MPKRCVTYGCRGNYAGEPYTRVVKFPTDDKQRTEWLQAMPNAPGTLENRKNLYLWASHFSCEWVSVQGDLRPASCPTIFPGVPKSCLKQLGVAPRKTKFSSCSARERKVQELEKDLDNLSLMLLRTFRNSLLK